jgi:hypothetical protein
MKDTVNWIDRACRITSSFEMDTTTARIMYLSKIQYLYERRRYL